jgi:hypothetical protein
LPERLRRDIGENGDLLERRVGADVERRKLVRLFRHGSIRNQGR